MYNIQCIVNSAQCTVYSVQCTVHSVQLYSARCTVYSVQCTVQSVQLYSAQCRMESAAAPVASGQMTRPPPATDRRALGPHTGSVGARPSWRQHLQRSSGETVCRQGSSSRQQRDSDSVGDAIHGDDIPGCRPEFRPAVSVPATEAASVDRRPPAREELCSAG